MAKKKETIKYDFSINTRDVVTKNIDVSLKGDFDKAYMQMWDSKDNLVVGHGYTSPVDGKIEFAVEKLQEKGTYKYKVFMIKDGKEECVDGTLKVK